MVSDAPMRTKRLFYYSIHYLVARFHTHYFVASCWKRVKLDLDFHYVAPHYRAGANLDKDFHCYLSSKRVDQIGLGAKSD